MKNKITVSTKINASKETVWASWHQPDHMVNWYVASDDWHVPWAKNDLTVGGVFTTRMEAKDASMGFDFTGTYLKIIPFKSLKILLGDGRTLDVIFKVSKQGMHVIEHFEAEKENPLDLQRRGWQLILDRFNRYTESLEQAKNAALIDAYIQTFNEDTQVILKKIRKTIHQAAPEALEKISYQMPTFYLSENLVHFAAYKNHIGFYPTPSAITAFEEDLKPYKNAKGSIQFPLNQPIPYDLIKKITLYRVNQVKQV